MFRAIAINMWYLLGLQAPGALLLGDNLADVPNVYE